MLRIIYSALLDLSIFSSDHKLAWLLASSVAGGSTGLSVAGRTNSAGMATADGGDGWHQLLLPCEIAGGNHMIYPMLNRSIYAELGHPQPSRKGVAVYITTARRAASHFWDLSRRGTAHWPTARSHAVSHLGWWFTHRHIPTWFPTHVETAKRCTGA